MYCESENESKTVCCSFTHRTGTFLARLKRTAVFPNDPLHWTVCLVWGTKDMATGDLEPAFMCLCMGKHRERVIKWGIKKYCHWRGRLVHVFIFLLTRFAWPVCPGCCISVRSLTSSAPLPLRSTALPSCKDRRRLGSYGEWEGKCIQRGVSYMPEPFPGILDGDFPLTPTWPRWASEAAEPGRTGTPLWAQLRLKRVFRKFVWKFLELCAFLSVCELNSYSAKHPP